MPEQRELTIRNKEGLHFRPIMQLVDAAQRFSAALTVHCDDRKADGRSPMELLMLMATHGAKIRFEAEGADAKQLLDVLQNLVDGGFGES